MDTKDIDSIEYAFEFLGEFATRERVNRNIFFGMMSGICEIYGCDHREAELLIRSTHESI